MHLTRSFAEFVTAPLELTPEAIDIVGRVFADTVAVGIAGAASDDAESLGILRVVLGVDDHPGAAVLLNGGRTTPATAALLNGTSCHLLDFDDVSHAMNGHPSTVLVPALLAAADSTTVSGASLAEGFAVGLQVAAALRAGLGAGHYQQGWHATSTIGTVAAAAAVSRVLGLSTDAAARALAVAASFASGQRANFGTMTKSLHAGHAAQWGYTAAAAAQRGFTANESQLETPGGYLALFGEPDGTAALRLLQGELILTSHRGINVKKHPCCYFAHRAIDAAAALRSQVDLDTVSRVRVIVQPGSTKALTFGRPLSGLAAKFSGTYLIGRALSHGSVDLDAFTLEAIADPRTLALAARVEWAESDTPPIGDPEWTEGFAVVEVTSTDGVHEMRVDIPRGDCRNPLDETELRDKFLSCVVPAIGADRAAGLYQSLRDLPSAASAAEWSAQLI